MTDVAARTTQLYWFETEPGDPDHLPSYYFHQGVVEAEPAEIEALVAELAGRHRNIVAIRPLEPHVKTMDELRAVVGGAIGLYHSEIMGDEACESDAPFIEAHDKATYG